jgi:hypothetical protein
MLEGAEDEGMFDVSRVSEVLTCRLATGVRSVSGFGEVGSSFLGGSSTMDAAGGCTGCSFSGSIGISCGRVIVEAIGGYEGGPRGAMRV